MTTRPLSVLTAAVIAAALTAGSASAEDARAHELEQTSQAGNIVTFGDSFSANPDQWYNAFHQVTGSSPVSGYPETGDCLQAPDSWPNQLRELDDSLDLKDWSCSGQTTGMMLLRIGRAVVDGDLNKDTRAVILPTGINNFGPNGILQGNNILDPNSVRDSYLRDMRLAAVMIRAVAPDTRIIIPSALAATDPSTAMYCALNVVPNTPLGVPLPIVRDAEAANEANQRAAADELDAEFIDVRTGSLAHNSCAPDAERYVAGVIDTTTQHYNMVFHPSRAGSAYMAERIAEAL